ncbi:MAG: hypothetical protein QXK89_04155 [Candidatus Bathyarchaeia archaeon]|nr:hypothetical protein [Candidatus Bathyarchaeota archaeon]
MNGRKINIFYLLSFICTIFLIAYISLIFLPQAASYVEYPGIRLFMIAIIALLLIAAGIQLFLLVKPPQSEE